MDFILSTAMTQGYRPYMEDTLIVHFANGATKSAHIFDGHGGGEVSLMCRDSVQEIFEREHKQNPDMNYCIRKTYAELDQMALKFRENVGSTGLSIFFDKNNIWFANCGDSETIVISKNSHRLMTQRHKVEDEQERLRKTDAQLTNDDGCLRINRMVNIGRSIGDHHLKKYVIADPYVTSIKNTKYIEFIFAASDGVWDVFSYSTMEMQIKMTFNYLQETNPSASEKEILDMTCVELIKSTLNKGSTDNISLILMKRV